MQLDQHFFVAQSIRYSFNQVIYATRFILNWPVDAFSEASLFFKNEKQLETQNNDLHYQALRLKAQIYQLQAVQTRFLELERLTNVLPIQLSDRYCVGRLYSWHDPLSYKLIFDKGTKAGLSNGQPVVDEVGLVGQITRVYPNFSEVTLIISQDQMIPVMIERTGERVILYAQNGQLVLPHFPLQADIQVKDRLITSGIDGVYPAGLPVAWVTGVVNNPSKHFRGLTLEPLAHLYRSHYAVVLLHQRISFGKQPH